uniref:Chlorophyll a-b binding protein, chloroplastic n=1 Tax=Ananas comosus var. bracteatus TaxID=296719 RepID=A0A6V7P763_ANACO|nr:unnamed protein product [Ananas comosus var. bracteatus]
MEWVNLEGLPSSHHLPLSRCPKETIFRRNDRNDGNGRNSGIGHGAPAVRVEDQIPRFSGKLAGGLAARNGTTSTSRRGLKVEAKGEWLPGLPSPAYLNGSLPGDNGFDPLGLAEDPENLNWYVQAELVNSRWAMLGVVGMLAPEVLTKIGLINAPQWYDAGKAEYFASSSTLFVIEFILFHYVEIRRWQDIKKPGSVNQDPIFKNYSLPPHECGYPAASSTPSTSPPPWRPRRRSSPTGDWRCWRSWALWFSTM